MSGSPVYIDDKLLGALAFGWSFSKEPIGGVTPFSRMRELAVGQTADGGGGGRRPELVELLAATKEGSLGEKLMDWLLPDPGRSPRSLPLAMTTSLAEVPAASGWLEESWRRLGWVAVPGGGEGDGGLEQPVRPGSMVAAVLVDGDAVMAAGGTVTEVRGDQVWAFGHPFLGGGSLRLPMARAKVVTVLPSLMSSFKFFTVGTPIGTFANDRSRGIWGTTGEVPDMVPVHVEVNGHRFDFRSVRHRSLSPFLLAYLVQASQGAKGRLFGAQTIAARIELRYAGEEAVVYEEVIAAADAPARVAALAAALSAYLEASAFEVPELKKVMVGLRIEEQLDGAELVDVVPVRRVVRPGEKLPIRLRLRPYRGAVFTRELGITVPAGLPDGRIDLVVADGASWSAYDLGMRPHRAGSFSDEVRLLNQLHPSTSIILALERREIGVALEGGSVPMPPGVVLQLKSGLGTNLVTTSYAVSAMVEEPMGVSLVGAERIMLKVRNDGRTEDTEAP
jgi:hypothetical protein